MKERSSELSAKDNAEKEQRPEFFIIDQEGEVYLNVKDASLISGLSRSHIRGLVKKSRIFSVKPHHDLFVSKSSLTQYLESGRKKPGRPRKSRDR